jgi:L-lysine epsilon oxidase C-terminal domain
LSPTTIPHISRCAALKTFRRPSSAAFTPDMVTLPESPLYGQMPGGITRWMAVPWQADTASCRSGYLNDPPEVLSTENYDILMKCKSLDDRLKALATRSDWLAPIVHGNYFTRSIPSSAT